MGEDLSENLAIRKKLIDIIKSKPGIHFRQVLEKLELVSKTTTKGYTRYYPAYELGTDDKRIMGHLRQEKLREIVLFLLSKERLNHKEISKHFSLLKSTTSFYMDKLIAAGIVSKNKEGRNVIYVVKEPQKILRLMLIYKKGFGEEIVKRVEDLWANL
jgi:predicted transcriptional regulator